MFGLQLFPHGEGERTLIQSFISVDGHIELISYSIEQDSSFRAIDCDLPYYLIKTLPVQIFSNRTYPRISSYRQSYLACRITNFSSRSFCRELTSYLEGGLVLIVCLKCLPSASHSKLGNILFNNSKLRDNVPSMANRES